MGHFSVETCAPPGSTLSANQQQKLSKLFFTSSQATSFISEMLETLASALMDVVAFFMVLLFIQD